MRPELKKTRVMGGIQGGEGVMGTWKGRSPGQLPRSVVVQLWSDLIAMRSLKGSADADMGIEKASKSPSTQEAIMMRQGRRGHFRMVIEGKLKDHELV